MGDGRVIPVKKSFMRGVFRGPGLWITDVMTAGIPL